MKNEEVKEKKSTTKKTTKKDSTKKGTNGTKKEGTKTGVKQQEVKRKEVKQPKKEIIEEKIENEEVEEEIIIHEVKKEDKPVKSKKIKTSDIVLILGLVLVAILGFFVMGGKEVEPTYELPLTLSGEVGLHQLTYQEYKEKIDNNEHFVIIIERATCSHCVTYMPIAEAFANDYGVPMYYVDTDTFSSEDWEGFEKSNTFFKKSKGSWGTPTTIVLAGSEAVDYVTGTTTAERLEELYNEYFEISKE